MNPPTSHVVASYPIRHATTRTDDVAVDVMELLASGVLLIDLSDHDRHARTVHLRIPVDHDDHQ